MGEFDFIEQLKIKPKENILSIGDDAAFFDGYLIAKDILVENIHFLPSTPIELVIEKLFVSNISDICAMGGYPKYCLLGISIPSKYTNLDTLIGSIKKMVKQYNVELIGGDTTKSNQDLFLSLTIIGKPYRRILRRDGAKPGDLIYLSRPIGLSKLSLEKELGKTDINIDPYLHYKNKPEIELAKILSNNDAISSCIDISDGLGKDAGHIATKSHIKVVIEQNLLNTSIFRDFNIINPIDYILSSGEEFALLFTINKSQYVTFEKFIKEQNLSAFKIGYVENGQGVFLKKENNMKNIMNYGFEHLI